MGIYLGIDGGGSKTSCVVGDETTLLGTGSSGASNLVRVGETKARASLGEAIQQACTAAGLNPTQIQRTCIGLAGAARSEVREWAHRTASEIVGGKIEIVGDNITALEAAFENGPGVIVVAGTGSIAYGRNSRGETARAGGWGFAISDEGSGHWIGRAAIGAALRAEDAGTESSLLRDVLRFWKLGGREELVMTGNATPPPDFAELVPVVTHAAESGDEVARKVLLQAASELVDLAAILIHKMFSLEPAQVAMSGGVFGHSSLVRESFYNGVQAAFPTARIKPELVDPMQGALSRARRAGNATRAT